jgi:beta-galactosidase
LKITTSKVHSSLIGLDISHQCFLPGNTLAEQILVQQTLGELESPYECEGALVYRLSGPQADHYYFINDGVAKNVVFRSKYAYKNAVDALTGEQVDLNDISLRADDARWIRMEK